MGKKKSTKVDTDFKYFIPSYNECKDIINNNPEMCFYENKYIIDGYSLSVIGYRLAKYNNFILPIIDKPHIKALELKGISYIFNDDGSIYDHNLMLHKFWELDQYDFIKYDFVKDKKISNITVKEDGFLITFIKLPNGSMVSQTKKGVSHRENIESNKFLLDDKYYYFINKCLNDRIQPIFEYVNNHFYVNYESSNLILIKLRNKDTGDYIDVLNYDTEGIKVVNHLNYTIDELIKLSETEVNIEGWVVQFDDGDMLKIKTKWWRNEKILRQLNK